MTSTPHKVRRILFTRATAVFLAIVVVVAIVVIIPISSSDNDNSSPTPAATQQSTTTTEVSRLATDYWDKTVASLQCFRSPGFKVIGPWPKADGSGISYSWPAEAKDLERECLGISEPLNQEFGLSHNRSDARALVRIREILALCLYSSMHSVGTFKDDVLYVNFNEVSNTHPDEYWVCIESI